MSPVYKNLISLMLIGIGVLLEVSGLGTIVGTRSAGGFKGIGFVILGLAIGFTAAIAHIYYQENSNQSTSQEKIELETLSKLPTGKRPRE